MVVVLELWYRELLVSVMLLRRLRAVLVPSRGRWYVEEPFVMRI